MELRQLRYFLSVADSRSFVSAASNLYISRQAVSKAISQLEAELGVELFVRDTSGAFLTPTGLLFYERVLGIVKELDNIAEQLRTSGNRFHQRIRIAFAVGTVRLMEERLHAFRMSRENLEIVYSENTEDECIRLLQEHQVDMIVSSLCSQNPQYVSEEITSSRIGVLLRKNDQMGMIETLDLNDLSWIPLAVQTDKRMGEFCSKLRINAQFQGHDYHRLFSMAASGKCGLLLPQCLVPSEIPGLRWIPLQQEEYWKLYSTYPQSVESSLLFGTVIDELKQNVFS